jgi:RNA polymerase sigma-70 factor (ECF subfamily)
VVVATGVDERAEDTVLDAVQDAVQDPEREALRRVADGDVEAFALLVERHQERLLRVCRRMLGDAEEARDATQEVLVKAFRKAGSYRPRGQVYTWLYRIAVNHCLNRLRRRKVVRFLQLSGPGGDETEGDAPPLDPATEAPDPLAELESRRRWQAARRALATLSPNQRAVLVLVRFEGLAYKEVAEVLGISLGAVESRLFRAMRNLEAALAAESGEGGEGESS